MKHHFLTAVGDGIRFRLAFGFPGMITHGDEIAVVVIAAEKAVQMVEHRVFAGALCFGGLQLCLRGKILLARFASVVKLLQIAVAVKHIAERIEHIALRRLEFGLRRRGPQRTESAFHFGQQLMIDELSHFPGAGMHDFIEAEIQIRPVQLKQLFELVQQFSANILSGSHFMPPFLFR